jgi:hypothetical protein
MRWLVSTEPDPQALRTVVLDLDGNVPPLAQLVRLAATREGAVATVEREAGHEISSWWRLGAHRGWDTWALEGHTWRRYRIQPLLSAIDVTPAPSNPRLALNEPTPPDVLVAMAAGDPDAVQRAVLTHGLVLARMAGDAELVDDLTLELWDLDVEGTR